MRIMIGLVAGLLPVSAAVAEPPAQAARVLSPYSSSARICPPLAPRLARGKEGRLFRQFDRIPPVDLHLAVDRRENGCPVAVIVRHNVGGPGR